MHNQDRLFFYGVRNILRCVGVWFLLPALAWSCQPQTELEEVYCQLRGKGIALPALNDFRRNDPKTQWLLLKRPAAREGISISPVSSVASAEDTKAVERSPAHSEKQKKTSVSTREHLVESLDQASCQLVGELIRCQEKTFHFVLNRPNHQLASNSLSAANRLRLPEFDSRLQSPEQYLSTSYRHYIEKMLAIGLGASTMSYSKFYYIWEDTKRQKQSFAARLETVFEFLKRDKKSLGVKPRYDQAMPEDLSWCQALSRDLWVCDNMHRNWVYQSRH
ncbi:hypothetical protein [Pseudomaricurvus sp.]|uniref:hypothetical protein n=1 Tax=Pseudomaricurvus sp. TaxID=2004510 RepID=UPI003F6C6485